MKTILIFKNDNIINNTEALNEVEMSIFKEILNNTFEGADRPIKFAINSTEFIKKLNIDKDEFINICKKCDNSILVVDNSCESYISILSSVEYNNKEGLLILKINLLAIPYLLKYKCLL